MAALLALYVAVVAAPVAFAWAIEGTGGRPLAALSSALAMSAYVVILTEFVLSGRSRSLSQIAGIDRLMRFHQVAGRIAAGVLFLHPFFYAAERLGSGGQAALVRLIRLFTAPAFASGVVAWVLLLLLVAVALWRDRLRVPYEVWRLSHGISALAVGALGLHHVLSIGGYSQMPILASFWVVLAGIAALAFAAVYLVRPLRLLMHPWRIVSVRQVAERQWEMTLACTATRALRFRAGQFAWITLGSPLVVNDHPFSIASPPSEGSRIALLIKESGDFTRSLSSIVPGTRAYVDGPYGAFTMERRSGSGVVFIAGGVGIAPILSLLRDAKVKGDARPMQLLYGNRSEAQIVYADELAALAGALNLRIHYVLSEAPLSPLVHARGQLDAAVLSALLGEQPPRDRLYFLCGPPGMMNGAEAFLKKAGVPHRQIVSERFRYD